MKVKNTISKKLIFVFGCIIFCCLILSACSSNKNSKSSAPVAMVKNASMSTYGTGFAVGIPGKPTDIIVTAYSVVATKNVVPPKTAEVVINENEKKLSVAVLFYDADKNVAILKLPSKSKEITPVILKNHINYGETVYVSGYDGTGNIMSDFDKFNTTDIVRYNGNISTYDELQSTLIYKYSNEFNRASSGAPAVDNKGYAVGMCAYSLNNMNTYSQYILSSDELSKLLSSQNIDFMTSDEVIYKNIIILSIIIGFILLAAITALTLIIGNKKANNLNFKDKYIKITDGTLKGKIYKFNGKITIGRDAEKCNIVYPINEPGISALHCTVQVEDGNCYLVDNFSKYGTFLEDGTKISPSLPHKIESNKFVFYIADTKNRFEITDKKESLT